MIRRSARGIRGGARGVVLLTGAAVAPACAPGRRDPVRAAEYWLDEYGIKYAWTTTRGAGVRIAIIDTGVGRGPVEFEGAVVGGTDVSGRRLVRRPHAGRRGRRQPRQLGRLARRGARHRSRHRA